MLTLDSVPMVKQKVVAHGLCALEIERLDEASTTDAAWRLLPSAGHGVVTLADRVIRFDPAKREGFLLEAEVAASNETTVLRSRRGGWNAWKWAEQPGDSHRWVEFRYLSSEPGVTAPRMIYRQYWTLTPTGLGEISVWQPVGARFCGFEEDSKA